VAKPGPGMIPHLRGVAPQALAQAVAKTGRIPVTSALGKTHIAVPKALAPVIARIDGRHTLDEIARGAGADWFALAPAWGKLSDAMSAYGLLMYSGLLRR
jgi:hypothetical protein